MSKLATLFKRAAEIFDEAGDFWDEEENRLATVSTAVADPNEWVAVKVTPVATPVQDVPVVFKRRCITYAEIQEFGREATVLIANATGGEVFTGDKLIREAGYFYTPKLNTKAVSILKSSSYLRAIHGVSPRQFARK